MANGTFLSRWSVFQHFEESILRKSRYVLDSSNKEFLEFLKATCTKRIRNARKGKRLYRAQQSVCTKPEFEALGVQVPFPAANTRMKPQLGKAKEGRVNPKGIPYLYLATDPNTAMAEMRASLGSYLTLSEFVLEKTLKILDCSIDNYAKPDQMAAYHEEPTDQEFEHYTWLMLNDAFSRPVQANDDVATYAPTQVLAEVFRHEGFDGVKYKSRLGNGYSVALFDLKSAELTKSSVHQLTRVNYSFKVIST